MKKVLPFLTLLILLVLSAIYIFIPGKITVSESLTIEANKNALLRKLGDGNTWAAWWPGEKDTTGTYTLNNISFRPDFTRFISVPLTMSTGGFNAPSELTLISLRTDSTTLHLETQLNTSYNPFKRASLFFASKKIKNSFTTILQSLNKTYSKIPVLYDYDIQKKQVVDSNLIFTSDEVKGYPSVDKIYSLVDELKNYIKKQGANETGHPMLNIYTRDSVMYLLKVAIPVDRKLPDAGRISYRWMLGGGNILITEVKGDQQEINKAYDQILHYISDYQRVAPAIPFESMVTDRRQERDSSKWITRIYYPVM